MTQEYVDAKIKEALQVSNNDKHAAQKLLVTWAVRDATLLIGLTKSHLRAIVSSHIDHALRSSNKSSDQAEHISKSDIDAIIAAKSIGDKRSYAKVPPPKSSQRQASAIHKLVAAFKNKKAD